MNAGGAFDAGEIFHRNSWLRRLRTRLRQRENGSPAPEAVLAAARRVLLGLALLGTLAAPLLVWLDAKNTQASFQLEPLSNRPRVAAAQRTANRGRNPAAVFAARQYFKIETPRVTQEIEHPVSAAEVPGLTEQYTLLGVLMGENPQAIVRENSTNASIFLSAGQRLHEYVVKKITPSHIVLEHDGLEIELRM